MSYDDFLKQKLIQLSIDFNNFKDSRIVRNIDGRKLFLEFDEQENQTIETSIFFNKENDKVGTLHVNTPQYNRQYFIRIERSLENINEQEIENFEFPTPELGETIKFNFNNVFQVVWRKNEAKKFISIMASDILLVRFVLTETENFEVYSIDTNLNFAEAQFWGKIVQQKADFLPIRPTQFLVFTAEQNPLNDGFYEITFLDFNRVYNDLVVGLLNAFSHSMNPFGIDSENGPKTISISF